MAAQDYTAAYLTLAASLGGVTLAGAFGLLTARHQSAAERGRADRAEVRKTLADALAAIETATGAFRELYSAVAVRKPDVAKLRSASEKIGAGDVAFSTARASLRIQLGDDHPICGALLTVSKITGKVNDAAGFGDAAEFSAAMAEREEAFKELVRCANDELGAVLKA